MYRGDRSAATIDIYYYYYILLYAIYLSQQRPNVLTLYKCEMNNIIQRTRWIIDREADLPLKFKAPIEVIAFDVSGRIVTQMPPIACVYIYIYTIMCTSCAVSQITLHVYDI